MEVSTSKSKFGEQKSPMGDSDNTVYLWIACSNTRILCLSRYLKQYYLRLWLFTSAFSDVPHVVGSSKCIIFSRCVFLGVALHCGGSCAAGTIMTEFLICIFSKIQNYSPTEAAKVYDKPLTRRTLVKFNPESVLNLMKKNKAPSDLEEEDDEENGDRQDREKVVDDYLEVRHGANAVKFLNFRTPENLAVIYLKFKTKWPNLRVFCQKRCKWNSKE